MADSNPVGGPVPPHCSDPHNPLPAGPPKHQPEQETPSASGSRPRYSSVLRVKADPREITPEQRGKNLKSLAGAITHAMRQFGEVHVRAFKPQAFWKAGKAMAVARQYMSGLGYDLYNAVVFIEADDLGEERQTGLGFIAVSSQSDARLEKMQQALDGLAKGVVQRFPDRLPLADRQDPERIMQAVLRLLDETPAQP